MLKIIQLMDGLYEATSEQKRVLLAVAVLAKAQGRPGSEFERLLQLADLNGYTPGNWSMALEPVDKSLQARALVFKHLNIQPDGTIIGLLCASPAVFNATIKAIEGYRGASPGGKP